MGKDTTTIKIEVVVKDWLDKVKKPGESYSEVIERLVKVSLLLRTLPTLVSSIMAIMEDPGTKIIPTDNKEEADANDRTKKHEQATNK